MRYVFFLCLLSKAAFAQIADSVAYVSYLPEVKIMGVPLEKYAAGSKVEKLLLSGESSLLDHSFGNAASVYFKTYGNSQLSTIAFRGTSASHTAVLWNGVAITNPTLGQTDFSLLPVFLLDEVSLQYGTSSSWYGSGALGGSVLINSSSPVFIPHTEVSVIDEVGSFGNYFTGAKIRIAGKRVEARSKFMYRTLENNFPYTSPAIGYRKIQNDAAVKQYGFDQQFHYSLSDTKVISLDVLYTWNLRSIQPSIGTSSSDETLKDINTRINLSYTGSHRAGEVYTSLAYIDNDELYGGVDHTIARQLSALVNVDKNISPQLNVRYGISWSLFLAEVDNYNGSLSEQRVDAFTSLGYSITPRWRTTLNLRESRYAGNHAPLAPSLGTDYKLYDHAASNITVRAQISRGYRVPTLNDRYWNPGGNSNLKPEDAWHIEAGMSWKHETEKNALYIDVTGFHTSVDQWILWLPTDAGYWSPNNLQKVNAYGAESSIRYRHKTRHILTQAGVTYSYTRSKNLEGLTPSDHTSAGKQLPYVPFHLASAFYNMEWKGWLFDIRSNFTGLRYTTLDNESYQSLESYLLADVSLSKTFRWQHGHVGIRGRLNNVFDRYYENLQNRAMPGRNYLLSLIFQVEHKPK